MRWSRTAVSPAVITARACVTCARNGNQDRRTVVASYFFTHLPEVHVDLELVVRRFGGALDSSAIAGGRGDFVFAMGAASGERHRASALISRHNQKTPPPSGTATRRRRWERRRQAKGFLYAGTVVSTSPQIRAIRWDR